MYPWPRSTAVLIFSSPSSPAGLIGQIQSATPWMRDEVKSLMGSSDPTLVQVPPSSSSKKGMAYGIPIQHHPFARDDQRDHRRHVAEASSAARLRSMPTAGLVATISGITPTRNLGPAAHDVLPRKLLRARRPGSMVSGVAVPDISFEYESYRGYTAPAQRGRPPSCGHEPEGISVYRGEPDCGRIDAWRPITGSATVGTPSP